MSTDEPKLPEWITVRAVTPKVTQMKDETEVLVQVSTIKRIAPGTHEGAIKGKITFLDGEVFGVADSYDYLKALVMGTLDRGYEAPEPKPPQPSYTLP